MGDGLASGAGAPPKRREGDEEEDRDFSRHRKPGLRCYSLEVPLAKIVQRVSEGSAEVKKQKNRCRDVGMSGKAGETGLS